jgi:hypothetical protein
VLNTINASATPNAIDPTTAPKTAQTIPHSTSGTTNSTTLKEPFIAA